MEIRLYHEDKGKRLYAVGLKVDPSWGELTSYDLTDKREEAEVVVEGDYFHKAFKKSFACRKGLLKEEREDEPLPVEEEPKEEPKPDCYVLCSDGWYIEEGTLEVTAHGDGRKPDCRFRLTANLDKAMKLTVEDKNRVSTSPFPFVALPVHR